MSAQEESPLPADAVEVGRILGSWGVRGWFKVEPFSDDPQALFSSRRWHLLPPVPAGAGLTRPAAGVDSSRAGASGAAPPSLLRITQAREHGDVIVASAQEVADRDAAQALKGGRVFVARSSFPTALPGEYYWVDLLGLAVVNRQGLMLGTVRGLMDCGPHSILRVQTTESAESAKSAADAEVLIPFVEAYVDAVDLAGRQITVDWQSDY